MEQVFVFQKLPENVQQMQALPEYAMSNPFMTAALTVAALCRYEKDPNATVEMLNALRGPRPLSVYETQFLRDRLAGKGYKPFSFFQGAVPANEYTPDMPYTIRIFDNPYSYTNEGYARLLIRSGGADSERPLTLRKLKNGQWLLWEQNLLSDIRIPESQNPWA